MHSLCTKKRDGRRKGVTVIWMKMKGKDPNSNHLNNALGGQEAGSLMNHELSQQFNSAKHKQLQSGGHICFQLYG